MYVSKKPYSEQIRIPTDKNQDDQIDKKHSEFKKPYLSDTYEEMEYFADAPIGYSFVPTSWGMDTPWMGTPVPNYEPYTPWHLLFMCNVSPCWCDGQEKCFNAKCTYKIVSVEWTYGDPGGLTLRHSGGQICIEAESGANPSGMTYIDINMVAPRPWTGPGAFNRTELVPGSHGSILVRKCNDSECCTADAAMAWDDAGSDDTVARSATANIAITGTNSPFTWSVSGTGFTLDYATTEGLGNVLNADAAACGTATITVTGCDDVSTTGYVACTTGVWSSATETYCYECAGGGSDYGWFYDWNAPLYRYAVSAICDTPAWCTGTPACSNMGLPKFITLKAECLATYGGARHLRGWSTIQPWACS
uniref:Uncharacterized protein n=1 Tax=viral metagenome TaxID=1070528 RepID=A0A6M3L8D6_9ZZZZ